LGATVSRSAAGVRARRLVPILIGWVVLSGVFAGAQLLFSWPTHPRSSLGWLLFLIGGLPAWVTGEYLIDRLLYRSRLGVRLDALGPGIGASMLRIACVLMGFLVICGVAIFAVSHLAERGWLSAL
jgi:hypothetical protein